MKKIIIACAIVTLTVASYGGQVQWTTSNFRAPGATTQILYPAGVGTISFSLVYAAGGDANFAWSSGATWGGDTVLNSAALTKNGGALDVITTANNGAFVSAGVPTTYSAYIVAFYKAGGGASSANATHYWQSSVFAATRPADWASVELVNNVVLANVSGRDLNMDGDPLTFEGTNWTAVPEPTSMALLALGVAALGLRRRFKK